MSRMANAAKAARGWWAATPLLAGCRGVALGILVAVGWAGPAAAQFSVQPVIIEMRPAAGGAVDVFSVHNESDEPLEVRVYASDYDQPEDGGHVFMDPGTHDRSCADRLRVYPDQVLLEPRGTAEVRVRMERGDSTCWSLVFVQSVSRAATGIRVAQRIGVKLYGVPAAAAVEGEVREVRVAEDAEGGREVHVAFANTGGAPIRPQGELEVRSEVGEVVGVVEIPPFSVLPGRVSRARIPLELELPSGTYVLVPILDFGGDYLAGGQALLRVGGP